MLNLLIILMEATQGAINQETDFLLRKEERGKKDRICVRVNTRHEVETSVGPRRDWT